MLSDLVSSSIEPEIRKLLHAVKDALVGVETRLIQQAESGDPITMLSAGAQLNAVHAWAPAIDDILKSLEPKPPTATARRIPPGPDHDH
jgi:hypothetical protein